LSLIIRRSSDESVLYSSIAPINLGQSQEIITILDTGRLLNYSTSLYILPTPDPSYIIDISSLTSASQENNVLVGNITYNSWLILSGYIGTITYNVETRVNRSGYWGTISINFTLNSDVYSNDGPITNDLSLIILRGSDETTLYNSRITTATNPQITIEENNRLLSNSSPLYILPTPDPSYIIDISSLTIASQQNNVLIGNITYNSWLVDYEFIGSLTYNIRTRLIRTGWHGNIQVLHRENMTTIYRDDAPTNTITLVSFYRGSDISLLLNYNIPISVSESAPVVLSIEPYKRLLNFNSPIYIRAQQHPDYIMDISEVLNSSRDSPSSVAINNSIYDSWLLTGIGSFIYNIRTRLNRTGYYGIISVNLSLNTSVYIADRTTDNTISVTVLRGSNDAGIASFTVTNSTTNTNTTDSTSINITEPNRLLNVNSPLKIRVTSDASYSIDSNSQVFTNTTNTSSSTSLVGGVQYKSWLITLATGSLTYNVMTTLVRTGYYGTIRVNWTRTGQVSETLTINIKANNVVVYTSNPLISSSGITSLHTITEGYRLLNSASLLLMSVQISSGYQIDSEIFSDALITRSTPDDGTYKRWTIPPSLIVNQTITYSVTTSIIGTGYYGVISVTYSTASTVAGLNPHIVVRLLDETQSPFLIPTTFSTRNILNKLFEIVEQRRLKNASSYLYISVVVTNNTSYAVQYLNFNNPNFITDNSIITVDQIPYMRYTIINGYTGPVTYSILLDKD